MSGRLGVVLLGIGAIMAVLFGPGLLTAVTPPHPRLVDDGIAAIGRWTARIVISLIVIMVPTAYGIRYL